MDIEYVTALVEYERGERVIGLRNFSAQARRLPAPTGTVASIRIDDVSGEIVLSVHWEHCGVVDDMNPCDLFPADHWPKHVWVRDKATGELLTLTDENGRSRLGPPFLFS